MLCRNMHCDAPAPQIFCDYHFHRQRDESFRRRHARDKALQEKEEADALATERSRRAEMEVEAQRRKLNAVRAHVYLKEHA